MFCQNLICMNCVCDGIHAAMVMGHQPTPSATTNLMNQAQQIGSLPVLLGGLEVIPSSWKSRKWCPSARRVSGNSSALGHPRRAADFEELNSLSLSLSLSLSFSSLLVSPLYSPSLYVSIVCLSSLTSSCLTCWCFACWSPCLCLSGPHEQFSCLEVISSALSCALRDSSFQCQTKTQWKGTFLKSYETRSSLEKLQQQKHYSEYLRWTPQWPPNGTLSCTWVWIILRVALQKNPRLSYTQRPCGWLWQWPSKTWNSKLHNLLDTIQRNQGCG